jgi:predicted HicB family RNase H-like nuclease
MKDCLTWKDYDGSVHFCSEQEIFYGKLEGIDDLVTFEGRSVEELKTAFKEAVEDYLELCHQNSKQPEKPCRGSFNVRIGPVLHKAARKTAARMGLTLNQFIQKAVEDELALFSG